MSISAGAIRAGTQNAFASGLLDGRARFIHVGVIQISLANFVVIVVMLLVFAAAILIPYPRHRVDEVGDDKGAGRPVDEARDE